MKAIRCHLDGSKNFQTFPEIWNVALPWMLTRKAQIKFGREAAVRKTELKATCMPNNNIYSTIQQRSYSGSSETKIDENMPDREKSYAANDARKLHD